MALKNKASDTVADPHRKEKLIDSQRDVKAKLQMYVEMMNSQPFLFHLFRSCNLFSQVQFRSSNVAHNEFVAILLSMSL